MRMQRKNNRRKWLIIGYYILDTIGLFTVAIFGPFLTHFDLIFKFIFVQNETRIEPKMVIFEKSNPSLAFIKSVIFTVIFALHFLVHLNSAPNNNFPPQRPTTANSPTSHHCHHPSPNKWAQTTSDNVV